jgi:hypothetical protein
VQSVTFARPSDPPSAVRATVALVLLLLPLLKFAVLPIPICSIPISDWPSLSGLLGARYRLPRCDERRRRYGSVPLLTLHRSCWPHAAACACYLGPATYSGCIWYARHMTRVSVSSTVTTSPSTTVHC